MWFAHWLACGPAAPPDPPPPPTPDGLLRACAALGEPRVETVADGVYVALGYDLANTVAIATADGLVVVDVGMTAARARETRAALQAVAPGPIRAVVYTHGHLDHLGGATAWIEPDTRIWATAALSDRFYSRYGELLPAEAARGARQFGRDLPDEASCCALGRKADVDPVGPIGAVLPTDTFSGSTALEVGGLRIELVEAHGETEDHLFVWIPEREVLLPGDNWYRAFPNLYTIRGTRPRPVDDWIRSLDAMRRLDPAVLVPSHTGPVVGRDEVRAALRTYRDGIRFVRDAVINGANRGERLDGLVERVHLPPRLANDPLLAEVYGQVDWSVRALYDAELGWFDGRAADLYPPPRSEVAERTVAAMGGPETVLAEARAARTTDPRWAVHLLALLEDAERADLDEDIALAYEALAATVGNGNGRSYLLQAAHERRSGVRGPPQVELSDAFVDAIPLELLFDVLGSRLRPEDSADVHESIVVALDDVGRQFVITVRYGVSEVVEGEPLPGTPAPLATVHTDAGTWRRLAVRQLGPAGALASGRLRIDGSAVGLATFLGRFDREGETRQAP